jgi:hypothetical protein
VGKATDILAEQTAIQDRKVVFYSGRVMVTPESILLAPYDANPEAASTFIDLLQLRGAVGDVRKAFPQDRFVAVLDGCVDDPSSTTTARDVLRKVRGVIGIIRDCRERHIPIVNILQEAFRGSAEAVVTAASLTRFVKTRYPQLEWIDRTTSPDLVVWRRPSA